MKAKTIIRTQEDFDQALALLGDLMEKEEEDPQDAEMFRSLAEAVLTYNGGSTLDGELLNMEESEDWTMGKGLLTLIAGSWGSMFVASWLVILEVVQLWPTAGFIALFVAVGTLAPLFDKYFSR